MTDALAFNGIDRKKQTFEDYFQSGKQAYTEGDHKRAHDLWREAATIDPYREKVWIALLRVLDHDDDRRVCLQNIIEINPGNAKARRQLDRLKQDAAAAERARKSRKWTIVRKIGTFMLGLVHGILIGALAASIGVGISILIYGFIG